jgi:hypothetical protein
MQVMSTLDVHEKLGIGLPGSLQSFQIQVVKLLLTSEARSNFITWIWND